ncbi:tRNA uridine-5-carboxymethylaminomethyl(34) synthesis GTPase MnmE [Xylocopilactobacillus apicola]|uniref:tRNA modification GTPase MnmE n=1 Tax=Xylocopilactobacillus apicola TaxID=2932184 RepID=A0AAU9DFK5_9LACO|nr:tRNA uridine-5-carboxymethylaminomethyl(34) synthesis GTPase MnmE [Xylocopilactobacillus apicola]BDR59732.1 tRNA modification GTPase MnmE [Xylocopilactobacillus apicola]
MNFMNDTIAAISTPPGLGAISIVRLSGADAITAANAHFKGTDLTKVASNTINYGHFLADDQEIIDEVMVSVMRAPKTYTKEDLVEINCHGGPYVTQKVLSTVLGSAVRLAEPGEFTKRAFLNGRIDLSEAEAVMDLINSKTNLQERAAVKIVDGALSKMVKDLREEMIKVIANAEVNIDYPEYDEEELTREKMALVTKSVRQKLRSVIDYSESGQVLKTGVKTAIIGAPNVGKSSLLNMLYRGERAIVTEIPGTTRDTLEEEITIGQLVLDLVDTAGIHQTEDLIEKLGIEKSHEMIQLADLVLLVFDGSREMTPEEQELLEATKNKKRIIIVNKSDLAPVLDLSVDHINISALNGTGFNELKEQIESLFLSGIENSSSATLLANARQLGLLKSTNESLTSVLTGLAEEMPLDLVLIDFNEAWKSLGEIIGENAPDELVNELFSRFCLGK